MKYDLNMQYNQKGFCDLENTNNSKENDSVV